MFEFGVGVEDELADAVLSGTVGNRAEQREAAALATPYCVLNGKGLFLMISRATLGMVVRCPLCGGEDSTCRVCDGRGRLPRVRVDELAARMSEVANAIQGGNADRAAGQARIAFGIARRLLDRGPD